MKTKTNLKAGFSGSVKPQVFELLETLVNRPSDHRFTVKTGQAVSAILE